MQDLFSNTDENNNYSIDLPDADVVMYPNFFSSIKSDELFKKLKETTTWNQETIKFYGKEIDLPRLTAWYGDEGKNYSYSGIKVVPMKWTPTLLEIKSKIEIVSGVIFNSVLLNYYRTGKDSVSWHSDDEPELGKNPPIGSVSFGAKRPFQLKHIENKNLKGTVELTNGSFLLMKGPTQHFWQHQIPKTTKQIGERINLTFRIIRK
jgi:alkylated DNA repair dioxygenase AlkB